MDSFFKRSDELHKLLINLKKKNKLSNSTKIKKQEEITNILKNLKRVVLTTKNKSLQEQLKQRYLHLKKVARQCLELLEHFETPLELEQTLAPVGDKEEITEEKREEEEEDDSEHYTSVSESEFESDEENDIMTTPTLDLGLALKIVRPFDGSAINLQSYIESIELLKDYAVGVPPVNLIKFLKITLTGTARGAFDGIESIDAAIETLKTKFGVKLTPKAVESEMLSKHQNNKNLTDFGDEISKLATKLAAAYVSQGTFASESAASNLVETVAVRAFTDGLKDPSTQFLLKARNPTTLNKAISDALECGTGSSKNETTLWFHTNNSQKQNRGHYSNNTRRSRGNRSFFRGRGYNNNYNNYRHENNYNHNNNYQRGGRYNNRYLSNRSGGNNRSESANVVDQANNAPRPQPQQQQQRNNGQEDANLIDLFR